VVAPYHESKSNTEVFRLLAAAMGYDDPAFQDSDEDMIRQALHDHRNPHMEKISFDELASKNYMKADVASYFHGKMATPSGKIELYSQTMADRGYPPLPTYTPLPDDGPYPYLFVPGPNHNFLNSTFSNNEKHARMEKNPRLHMNRSDATKSGIEEGDTVRVWNSRGECELSVSVGENVLPGVVVSQGLWADSPQSKHFVNALTPDRTADMGGGATFFSGRVDVAKC